MGEPSAALALIKPEEELMEAQQGANGAGPSGLKRPEPGATLAKATKKQRLEPLKSRLREAIIFQGARVRKLESLKKRRLLRGRRH